MPSFCTCGSDEVICQICGKLVCTGNMDARCMHVDYAGWHKYYSVRAGRAMEGNLCNSCERQLIKRDRSSKITEQTHLGAQRDQGNR